MGSGKDIVITAYGHDQIIDKIAISAFDKSVNDYGYKDISNAETYCDTINSLKLNENSWVFAKAISENMPYALDAFFPLRIDILLRLDNRAIQKILKEFISQESAIQLAIALKGEDETIREKIMSNMSKRAAQMLKEDMEYMGPVRKIDVIRNQEKISNVIHHLTKNGEIFIPHSEGELIL